MAGRLIAAFTQFFDGAGDPLAYGWLRFLESGSNNTPKDSFNDSELNIANANPLRLDGEGRCPSVFGEGRYRVVSYYNDPNDETTPGAMIQSFDPVTAQEETSAGGGGATFEIWDNSTEYVVGDIVTHSSKYYRSIANFNTNKNPAVEDGYWEEIEFVVYWNENVDYDIGEMVRDSGNLYFSTIANNLNNIPDESPVEWRRVDHVYLTADEYTVNYPVLVTDRDKLLVMGSAAILAATFTLPAVTSDHDGYIYNFYNASDYDMYVVPTVPATLWLSNTITLKKGSYLQLQYDSAYDKWLPIGNSGPALGGQDLGTLANPILDMYINDFYFVGNFDIDLAGTALWRFHTDGTFIPLSTNPLQNIGTLANQISNLWMDGYHYFLNANNWIYGNASYLQVNAEIDLRLTTTADATKYLHINAAGLQIAGLTTVLGDFKVTGDTTISGTLKPGNDDTYTLGVYQTREWQNLYIGSGRVWFRNGYADIQHDGSSLNFTSAVGGMAFLNSSGTSWRWWSVGTLVASLSNDGELWLRGDGSTVSYNLAFGSSGQAKIYSSATRFVLYTSGHLDIYTNNTARWWFDDTTGHLYPYTANTYQIGHPSYEVYGIYLGTLGAYFGLGQEGRIYHDASLGLLAEAAQGVSIRVNSGGNQHWARCDFLAYISGTDPVDSVFKYLLSFRIQGEDGRTYYIRAYGPTFP